MNLMVLKLYYQNSMIAYSALAVGTGNDDTRRGTSLVL